MFTVIITVELTIRITIGSVKPHESAVNVACTFLCETFRWVRQVPAFISADFQCFVRMLHRTPRLQPFFVKFTSTGLSQKSSWCKPTVPFTIVFESSSCLTTRCWFGSSERCLLTSATTGFTERLMVSSANHSL